MLGNAERIALNALDERHAELRLSRPGVVAGLRRSLARDGQLSPLLVNRERDGKLAVLDGLKRLRALRELGSEHALVRVVEMDDAAACTAMVVHNAAHQGLCELEQAWVVRSLVRDCRLQQSRVAELLGHHKSWVCRRLALAERLDETLQQDMRLGLVSATLARELSRLPRGNQARVALTVREHGLSSRACATLVERALGCCDERQLAALLHDPWRCLAAREPVDPPPDPRLGQAAERVRQDLLSLERAAQRLIARLAAHPPSSLVATELEVLAELAGGVGEQSRTAVNRIDELLRLRKAA
jgi:ParB/RepB/Spo0J family partition protein